MIRNAFWGVVWSAALLLLIEPAAAQSSQLNTQYVTQPQHEVAHLVTSLKRTFVPVQLKRLEGPSRLKADEAGVFQAVVNVESVTLPLRCQWDFGDGTTAAGLSARHTFREPGTYRVAFTISNGRSLERDTLTVTVRGPGGGSEPAAG